ncbi:MAG: hypothetical protein WC314_26975, partial [Vulcanimicrobiota bacterium]
PFIPTVKGADKEPLAAVLERYAADPRPKSQKVDLLEEFLKEHPGSPWAPSVRVNLGLYYQSTGRFTRTLGHLAQVWTELKDSKDHRLRALADHAFGAYTQTLAHLGRVEELEPLLKSVEGRSFSGSATELVATSREGLYTMQTAPGYSFWCGPAALRRLGRRSGTWTDQQEQALRACLSTSRGTSLLRNRDLSRELGLNYQMAYRQPGSRLITPAVVHWKAGHFAAIFESEAGYSVEDDTAGFLRDEVRMTKDVLDEEASGYFLIPPGPLPPGWRSVSEEEGKAVWGRGYVSFEFDGDATGDDDVIIGPPGSDKGSSSSGWSDGDGSRSGSESGTGGGGGKPCQKEEPLTNWSCHAMVVSLRLVDTPVGLSPAAFSVPFRVTYAQREMGQPAVFDYSNLGPKWTSNWNSFITDERNENGKVRLYKVGGGTDEYTFTTSTVRSDRGPYSQAFLNDTGQGFVLDWPNGSHDHYSKLIGNRYHLTRRTSPQGNDTRLEYDQLGRLSQIIDPFGRVMSLSYGISEDPLKITRVTDPFGRSAEFTYTADGHLQSITDVIGLTSSFQYGANDFVNALTTPYGTTTFSYADGKLDFNDSDIEHRILEVTDAQGRKHRVENAERGIHVTFLPPGLEQAKEGLLSALTSSSNNTTGLVPVNVSVPFSESEVPVGLPVLPEYQDGRNTFYWAPHQLDEYPDTSKATIYHFLYLGDPDNAFKAKSRVLESIKPPLENRIWFAYPDNDTVPGYFRGDDSPTHVARVLSDGTTQLRRYQYNSQGNVTQMVDPAGRVFDYLRAPNGIDLLGVSTGGQTLFSATYDSHHNILTLTGSDGQTSEFGYDARGLLQTALNPLGELSSFSYTPTGNLAGLSGPLGLMASFGYDSAERVSSATDSEGYTVQVTYDNADRPLALTYPDGTQDTLAYDRLDLVRTEDRIGRVTQTTFDSIRRLLSLTDGNG